LHINVSNYRRFYRGRSTLIKIATKRCENKENDKNRVFMKKITISSAAPLQLNVLKIGYTFGNWHLRLLL